MCTEQLSHIPPAEGHTAAAGFVCSVDLYLSVEKAVSLFDEELSKTKKPRRCEIKGIQRVQLNFK